jgi:hypothetical protein
MKTKYPNLFGILAVLMLVASFVVPVSLTSPSAVQADPGICKWDTIREPNAIVGTYAILNPSDIVDLAIGSDFNTVYAIVDYSTGTTILFQSSVKGLLWSTSKWNALVREVALKGHGGKLFQVAVAPDNPNFLAVTSEDGAAGGPRQVWVSQNGGAQWDLTLLVLPAGETIRSIDISVDYGGRRDIALGTTTGAGAGRIWVVKSTGFSGWIDQKVTTTTNTDPTILLGTVDFFAVKFSPSYASDSSLVVVYANNTAYVSCNATVLGATTNGATFYNVALRDIEANTTLGWAINSQSGLEVKDATWPVGASPGLATLNKATLQLPSDFSGQAASLRRAYISLDAMGFTATTCAFASKMNCDRDGIFRIDDTTPYTLMDTSNIVDKSIYSIAYFGTYASGKLLAGERMGYPCSATVPTWFTDSPTTCPIPCWYPALKPTTGAACQGCTITLASKAGIGAAIVAWAPPGTLAYVATGSKAYNTGATWYDQLYTAPVGNDESAVAISRNNGETWNQVSFIDTTITRFTDLAPTADCKTIYLASANVCGTTPLTYSVSMTANVTVYGTTGGGPDSANVTIATLTWPVASSTAITFSGNTTTTSSTWDPATCEATYTIILSGNAHCVCSTCTSCVVPFTVTAHAHIISGVPVNTTVTVAATGISCVGQIGCTTSSSAAINCCFDSVWRTTLNPDVASPIAAQPVGILWERVFTHVTAPDCTQTQTDAALLRLVPYCADPTGEIVAWAVYGGTFAHGVAAWSPDFGDYWAMLTPRNTVQDFTFESRTVMYFLNFGGLVQKMPYTGTAWSSSLPNVDSNVSYAHTIAAYPEGKVLVGAYTAYNAAGYATSYSGNMNTDNPSFSVQYLAGNTGGGDVHVAFDPNFKDNNTYFIGTGSASGSVFRNNPAAQLRWADTNMMSVVNGAVGCTPHAVGQYGIALAFTGQALYSAHTSSASVACGVDRTIDDGTGKYGPLSGMPKPGIAWDHLSVGLGSGVCFTREPSSLKICGCCTLDSDSTLYALDARDYNQALQQGLIWAFTDCLAKRGPALITEDKTLIGCDPVSGRAQEVNFCWEQLCIANEYDIEIAKNAEFTIRIIDWATEDGCGGLSPADVTAPCAFFPAGGAAFFFEGSAIAMLGNLECGHTYYWRIKARSCATTQVIRSPWSEVRSFTVKAGLPVVSTYLGLTLLAPNNGCLGCPVQPVSFSWSPFKETTKYKFQLASDAGMTQLVKEAEVANSTAFEYDGALDYSTNYFWRVMSMEPAPSDWSATFSLQTEAKPVPITTTGGPTATPLWVWVVIAIGAILVIVTLVLIFKTRRV